MRAKDLLFRLALLAVVGSIAVGSTAAAAVVEAAGGSTACPGDCDGNGTVAVNELVQAVNIALDRSNVATCPVADIDNSESVAVNELVTAVNAALVGCPSPPGLVMAPSPRVLEANIHSIGIEWDIVSGDAEHLAKGRICYRKRGESDWKTASLYRVDYHGYYEDSDGYRRFNMFAGSLMFLEPGTPYELQLKVGTPPAQCGGQRVLPVATRPIPQRGPTVRTLHVKGDDATAQRCEFISPRDVGGGRVSSCDCASTPTRPECTATICNGRSVEHAFIGFAQAELCAKPGDRILVHQGTYRAHRFVRSGTDSEYISWVGVDWERLKQRAAVTLCIPGQTGGCATDATAADGPGVKGLVLEADHLWFEGLDLVPLEGFEGTFGRMVGFAGDFRPPDNCDTFEQCRETCRTNATAHCDDYGTSDIVIARNRIRNFSIGVAAGVWCDEGLGEFKPAYWKKQVRSWRWGEGNCGNNRDPEGAIWGRDQSGMADDRHRADMHRNWYVADNVVSSIYPDGNMMLLTFLADSDVAYNYLSRTQHRSDWNTLKDKLLSPNCKLGVDESGTSLWPTQADCGDDKDDIGRCGNQGKFWECPAEWRGMESGPPCHCPFVKNDGNLARPEPDVMFLGSTSNVDVYGNEGRDALDNFIQGDWSYANLRIWRNRAVDPGNAMLTQAPMMSAPWYVVRNELISYSGPAFMPRVFDRTVIVNNTFVVRRGTTVQPNAQMLLRSVARNNLWILGYQPAGARFGELKCQPHGEFWGGTGSMFPGDAKRQRQPGQSHSDYRTDVNFDGLDWGSLPGINQDGRWESFWKACYDTGSPTSCCSADGSDCTLNCAHPGTILWDKVLAPDDAYHFGLNPTDPTAEFRRMARGCAGGPRDGKYCESDADCSSTTDVLYDRNSNGEIQPADPNSTLRCVYPEADFTPLRKENTLALCAGLSEQECIEELDDYASTEGSSERLTAEGDAIDAGDPAFFASEQHFLSDIGPTGKTIVPFGSGIPDLGAYEAGQPKVHYGPRP